jgi:serine/threonine protein kinase
VVSNNQEAATLLVKKEAVALGRIGERVPPTPFVVKLIEAGFLPEVAGKRVRVPWIAVEYVHGGLEGTTLTQRVCHSIYHSQHAFDVERAANAIRCIGSGLGAIHEVGVVHRDVTPRNVLCCGFGADELFKIADLGLARPKGMQGTFNATVLGTPGYAAPEQALPGSKDVSPASDVFSMAAVVFYLLTGEDYFPADSVTAALIFAKNGPRRRLQACSYLHPDLRARPHACAEIDAVLETATAIRMEERLQNVQLLTSAILGILDSQPRSARQPEFLSRAVTDSQLLLRTSAFDWQVRERPSSQRLVYHAKWSADGRCLAVTNNGVEYWDGTWRWPSLPEPLRRAPLCFAALSRPGQWLVGGEEGQLGVFTGSDYEVLEPGAPRLRYTFGSGDPDDLAVFVAQTSDGPPMLCALIGRRWLKPLALEVGTGVNGITRVGESTWLVVGRSASGGGFAALYDPLLWELTRVADTERPLLDCAASPSTFTAVAVGIGGTVLRVRGIQGEETRLDGGHALSCVALNATGRAIVGAAGRLWEAPAGSAELVKVWEDPSWELPFISLFSDVGLSYALTPEGAVLEGRQQIERQSRPALSRTG